MEANQLATFGDARRMMLDTIADLRAERITPERGIAIAAVMKGINDNINGEINAAKLAIATEGKAHSFGRVVGMGQRLIGNDSSQTA